MIGRIKGQLAESNPPHILVDVHGVGYEIDVPMSTFYNLPSIGSEVTLLTHMVVREDAQLLYGFLTAEERETFRQLLKVSGIGARTALSILSGMSVADLVNAVALQQASLLTRVPGIGKKTAERLILELKDKLPPFRDKKPRLRTANRSFVDRRNDFAVFPVIFIYKLETFVTKGKFTFHRKVSIISVRTIYSETP